MKVGFSLGCAKCDRSGWTLPSTNEVMESSSQHLLNAASGSLKKPLHTGECQFDQLALICHLDLSSFLTLIGDLSV